MSNRQRVVAFLVSSPSDMINLVAISSVFSYPSIGNKQAYITVLLSAQSEREIRGRDGITLSNCIPYEEYEGAIDTLVVLGGSRVFGPPATELIHWLRKRAANVSRLVSVCTGAFVLAPTGLLDGKRITTHWHHSHRLAHDYPKLSVEKDRIFIKDGNVYTTAGVSAGMDMALAIVEEDFGSKTVAAIAHTMVLYMRRPGNEAQYSTILAQQADVGGTGMRDLPSWTKANLAEKLDVSTLAKVVSMTPRTFARQFEVHFQMTPARWVQALRIEAVCEHLGSDELPLKVIASLTGFNDEKSLRRAFVQQLAITPKEYREKFGLARSRESLPLTIVESSRPQTSLKARSKRTGSKVVPADSSVLEPCSIPVVL